MTTDTYITRLEDVVKHPEMMPDLSSIRGDIACLLASYREVLKQLDAQENRYIQNVHNILGIPTLNQEQHTYECAKRE